VLIIASVGFEGTNDPGAKVDSGGLVGRRGMGGFSAFSSTPASV